MYFTLLVKKNSARHKGKQLQNLSKKNNKDKRLIQNWRPVSLLNVCVKIIFKALSKHLRNVLPPIIGVCVLNVFHFDSGHWLHAPNILR